MKVGCDLDGVIIDHRKNQKALLKKRGFNVELNQISKDFIKSLLRSEDYILFKKELYGEMSLVAEEIPGARVALESLQDQGHEIRIISRRTEDRDFAKKWLSDRGFGRLFTDDHIHFVSRDDDKEQICKDFNISIHIDDSPEVLEKLFTPKHKILFGNHAIVHPAATCAVSGWPDVLGHIKSIERGFR